MGIYHFLIKSARFTCVCAFFVVPLHRICACVHAIKKNHEKNSITDPTRNRVLLI